MKITDKKKPVQTIPKGVWESSRPRPYKDNDTQQERPANKTTDLQGNGYPVKKTT